MVATRHSEFSTAAKESKSVSAATVDPESLNSYEAESYATHLVLSVIAIVFCGVFFGAAALIFAVKARRMGGPAAMQDGKISLILSGIGIVTGVCVGLIVGLAVGLRNESWSPNFGCDSPKLPGPDGNCYNYEQFESDPTVCTGLSGYYDVHASVCYYDNNNNIAADVPTTTTQSSGDVVQTPSLMPPSDSSSCADGQIYGSDGNCYDNQEPSTQDACDTLPGLSYFDTTTGICYYNDSTNYYYN